VAEYAAIENADARLRNKENEINALKQDYKNCEEDFNVIKQDTEKAIQELKDKEEKLASKNAELDTCKKELSKTLGNKEISELLEARAEQQDLIAKIKNLISLEVSIQATQKEITDIENQLKSNKNNIADIEVKLPGENESLALLESNIKLMEETIDLAKIVQSLDEHRRQLKDGEDCPLCGSKEHPYALGNQPIIGEKENQLIQLKNDFKKKAKELEQIKISYSTLTNDIKNATKTLSNTSVRFKELISEHNQEYLAAQTIEPDFNLEPDYNNVPRLNRVLSQKEVLFEEIKEQISKANDLNEKAALIRDQEIPELTSARDSAQKKKNDTENARNLAERDLQNLQGNLNKELEEYASDNAKFQTSLQVYDVEDITALKQCLDEWNDNEKQKEDSDKLINDLKTDIALFEISIKKDSELLEENKTEQTNIESEIQHLIKGRQELFGDKSVEDEETTLRKLVDAKEKDRIFADKEYGDLKLELEKLKGIIASKTSDLSKLTEKVLTDKSIDDLNPVLNDQNLLSDKLSEEIGAGHEALRNNAENRKSSEAKIKERDEQQLIVDKWEKLNDLIGSADGKKFRNFAQALTFEQLTISANKFLRKMSDRYLLKRSGDISDPFELAVIDRFQNDEERTAENICGGESFMVSLSLALGLANMASNNIQIDTMFVDEGFGTLDSENLDMALSALSSLQSDGKIIGVISHIAEVKESISTHIEVVPTGNGHSRIQIIA
jgi:exonuclease SbcC